MLKKETDLLENIRGCTTCADLPLGPRPILQFTARSKLLIVGQAPGRKTHDKGIPFDDPSGDRLRSWLGLGRKAFYNADKVAVVPMGFCFPGTGRSGDLPPRKECAEMWRKKVLDCLQSVELTLVIGRYALDWHLPQFEKFSVTEAVKSWDTLWPSQLILPHPSPRNNRWIKQNPWFEEEIIPALQCKIRLMF